MVSVLLNPRRVNQLLMLGERARDIQVTIDGNPLAGLTARWTA